MSDINPRDLRGDAFRDYIRQQSPCPTCGVEVGRYCLNNLGQRQRINHAKRVEAVTGQDLSTVAWGKARGTRGREKRRKATPRPVQRYVEFD